MYGAIIGDLAGSIYEFEQTKKVKPVEVGNIIEKDSFYSDDTILTIAILDAILNDGDYESHIKKYGLMYKDKLPDYSPYFKGMFSPNFTKWLEGKGSSCSKGNGAMMRISPVGYLFNSEKQIEENVVKATKTSHDSSEAIECATIIAKIIFYARKGYTKDEILSKINITLKYTPFEKFNVTCSETIDNCLYALFTSNDFEETIRKVISYGGDTDTNACIVGSMAESLFGIDESLIEEAEKHLPEEFVKTLKLGYKKMNNP